MSETEAIIDRLKEVYGVKTNKDLSLLVGLAANGKLETSFLIVKSSKLIRKRGYQ